MMKLMLLSGHGTVVRGKSSNNHFLIISMKDVGEIQRLFYLEENMVVYNYGIEPGTERLFVTDKDKGEKLGSLIQEKLGSEICSLYWDVLNEDTDKHQQAAFDYMEEKCIDLKNEVDDLIELLDDESDTKLAQLREKLCTLREHIEEFWYDFSIEEP